MSLSMVNHMVSSWPLQVNWKAGFFTTKVMKDTKEFIHPRR